MAGPTEEEKRELRRQAEASYPPPGMQFEFGGNYTAQWYGEDADDKKGREALIQKEYERLLYEKYPSQLAADAAGSCLMALLSLAGLAAFVWILGLFFR